MNCRPMVQTPESGSVADPWHFGTDPLALTKDSDPDPTPDPAIFVNHLQGGNKKKMSKLFCLLLFQATFTSFFKDKMS